MKNFLATDVSQVVTFATVVVIFTYNVLFDIDVACSCSNRVTFCIIYSLIPVLIIIFLMLLSDKVYRRVCRYCCTCSCPATKSCCASECTKCKCASPKFCCVILLHLLKACSVGLLWPVSLFIDGDWYICCKYGQSEGEAQISCQDKKTRTAWEQVQIDHLNKESKMIGFFILGFILLLAVFISCIKWRKCCEKLSPCCDRKFHYQLIMLEEGETFEAEQLKEEARKELTARLRQIKRNPEDIFDFSEELVDQKHDQVGGGAMEFQRDRETNQELQGEIDTQCLLPNSSARCKNL